MARSQGRKRDRVIEPPRVTSNPLQEESFSTVPFTAWEDFKGRFRSHLPGGCDYDNYKRFIFRGQGDSRWPLKSAFDREYGDKSAGHRDKLAKELIREFYEECARQSEWRYGENDHRVLAMAQHHGLPTRLLDWSFSPYVAAYFAFSWFLFEQSVDPGKNIAIWAINREELLASAPSGQLEVIYVQDHENAPHGQPVRLVHVSEDERRGA